MEQLFHCVSHRLSPAPCLPLTCVMPYFSNCSPLIVLRLGLSSSKLRSPIRMHSLAGDSCFLLPTAPHSHTWWGLNSGPCVWVATTLPAEPPLQSHLNTCQEKGSFPSCWQGGTLCSLRGSDGLFSVKPWGNEAGPHV